MADRSVELTEKQLEAIKVAPVELRSFGTFKTSVGTIDFNQNQTVQVFSQYPGKIVRAFFNLGDTALHLRATWPELGVSSGKHTVRDMVHRHEFAASDHVEIVLPEHASAVYWVQ